MLSFSSCSILIQRSQIVYQIVDMYTLALLMIAVPALARTTPLSALVPRQDLSKLTVSEANDACGNGQTISCCNSIEQGDDISESDGVLSGIANGLLGGGLSLADGCSKLDVAARTYTH